MVKRTVLVGVILVAASSVGLLAARRHTPVPAPAPVVALDTEQGLIEFELYPQDAPKSVDRILTLVKQDFYRGQRFHWVTGSVIQIGDPQSRNMLLQPEWGRKGTGTPIGVAEFSKRSFTRGAVGMAWLGDATKADSQFFITKVDSTNLDGKYTMIGRVTKGMAIVDKIEVCDLLKIATVK